MSGAIVAVDAGGSKTDAVALGIDGEVLAFRRGPGASPHVEGLAGSVAVVDELVRHVVGSARPLHVGLYVSGLDLDVEVQRYREAIEPSSWSAPSTAVANDLYALLRAGTDELDAIAVICGTGINAVGVRADGVDARFPALGEISGDWGGGGGLGTSALWHAARDVDGRGPRTELTSAVLAATGSASIPELIEDLHFARRDIGDLTHLAPAVLATAARGDAVAVSLVERQADEIAAFVRACVTRLRLEGRAVPVVLGGGVIRSGDLLLLERVTAAVSAVAPMARVQIVDGAPIVGAALLALERVGADAAALARARASVEEAASVRPG